MVASSSRRWLGLSAAVMALALTSANGADEPPQIDATRVWRVSDDEQRSALLLAELTASGLAKCTAWLQAVDARPPCAAQARDRVMAVEFLAMRDPRAALAYVQQLNVTARSRTALLIELARGWTRNSPDAAWEWAAHAGHRDDEDLRKPVLEALAEFNPATGFSFLIAEAQQPGAATDSAVNERLVSFFARLADIGDFAACREWIERYPAGEHRQGLVYFVGSKMAEFALEDTTTWAMNRLDRPDALESLVAVGLERAKRDALPAVRWCLNVRDAGLRADLVRYVVAAAIERTPTAERVAQILDQLPEPRDRQAAYCAFATNEELLRADAPKYLEWAAQIEAPKNRRRALLQGYGTWFGFAPDAARKHLAGARALAAEDRAAVEHYLRGPGEEEAPR